MQQKHNQEKIIFWPFQIGSFLMPAGCSSKLENILSVIWFIKNVLLEVVAFQHDTRWEWSTSVLLKIIEAEKHRKNFVVFDNQVCLVATADKRVSKDLRDSFSFPLSWRSPQTPLSVLFLTDKNLLLETSQKIEFSIFSLF